MIESEYIKLFLEKLENHCNMGPIKDWTDFNFVKLSLEISKSTGILISKNTLKRLMGKIRVAEDYKPQRATKMALAQFVGYKTWDEFCLEVNPEHKEEQGSEENNGTENKEDKGKFRKPELKAFLLISGLFALGLLFWFVFNFQIDLSTSNDKKADFDFSIKNPVDSVPFTLVVKYEARHFENDSAILKMPDGKIHLSPERNVFTNNITLPTYTWITFFKGKEKLKSLPIHCLSKGWEYRLRDGKNLHLLSILPYIKDGLLGFDSSSASKLKITDTNYWGLDIRNVKNFEIGGDNFDFEIQMFCPTTKNDCQGTTLKFYGAHGHIQVRLFPKGCRQHNFIILGEKNLLGRYEDLTQIPFENGKLNKLRIQVHNKKFNLILNDKTTFSDAYQNSIGPLKGIFLDISKFGKVDYFRLWDQAGTLKESQDF